MDWNKVGNGYEMTTAAGVFVLAKTGKTWTLSIADYSFDLGKKATFDHAETLIAELLR